MADMYEDYAVLYYHCNGVLGNKFPLHTSPKRKTPEKKRNILLLLCIVEFVSTGKKSFRSFPFCENLLQSKKGFRQNKNYFSLVSAEDRQRSN
jgi:hypothetical protein